MCRQERHLPRRLAGWPLLAGLVAAIPAAGADVLLYRGQHVYLVPKVIGDRMIDIAPASEWRHFPSYTRRIDSNDDGRDDYIAIAVGADSGHGVQIRYRLERGDDEGADRLGRWYWAVMTDASGESIFQSFND